MSTLASAIGSFYRNDEDKSEKGVEIILGKNAKGEDFVVTVGEAGNPLHENAQRKHSRALEKARHNKKRSNRIWAEIMAEGILFSWRGLLDAEGNTIEPTMENRIEALESNKRFMGEILDIATDATNYLKDADELTGKDMEEETEGNSETASVGKSATAKK